MWAEFCLKQLPCFRHCVFMRVLSCDPLFVTPWTVAHQTPLCMEFSRQESWSGLPFSTAIRHSERKVKVKSLSRVWLLATPWTIAHQALRPWDFPGKSTGVGCHCLLWKTKTQEKLTVNWIHVEPSRVGCYWRCMFCHLLTKLYSTLRRNPVHKESDSLTSNTSGPIIPFLCLHFLERNRKQI